VDTAELRGRIRKQKKLRGGSPVLWPLQRPRRNVGRHDCPHNNTAAEVEQHLCAPSEVSSVSIRARFGDGGQPEGDEFAGKSPVIARRPVKA